MDVDIGTHGNIDELLGWTLTLSIGLQSWLYPTNDNTCPLQVSLNIYFPSEITHFSETCLLDFHLVLSAKFLPISDHIIRDYSSTTRYIIIDDTCILCRFTLVLRVTSTYRIAMLLFSSRKQVGCWRSAFARLGSGLHANNQIRWKSVAVWSSPKIYFKANLVRAHFLGSNAL